MPTRRLKYDSVWRKERPCLHPEHFPPSMIVLEPGYYEHECPSCGAVTYFVVPPRPNLMSI